jgi:hypothetical protein
MDYITHYYKNLSEQLSQKVNTLKKQLYLYENLSLPQGGQNLIMPSQAQTATSGKISTSSDVISKTEGPSRGEAHWYNKPINPFSAGDPSDQANFNARYAYIIANWNNMTELQRQGTLAQMMAGAPANMSGQQFMALFPQYIQSFLSSNYNSIYQIYSDTWG